MLHYAVLKIQTLASGSKGNATYIASNTTRILVDVGLSLPQLLARMKKCNIDPNTIDAILITHEHTDHTIGLEAFLKKFKSIIHLHEQTAEIFGQIPEQKISYFSDAFQIGDIKIDFMSLPHDSRFCFGYTFQCGNAKISLATDLGRVTPGVLAKMAGSQIVMLECNHDLVKLSNNKNYPPYLKRRITSSLGHLSNAASALAILELARNHVQQVILAHLSEQNNSPSIAYTAVRDFLMRKGITEGQDISIDVATQNDVSLVFQVD